jgi:hypothetical protein
MLTNTTISSIEGVIHVYVHVGLVLKFIRVQNGLQVETVHTIRDKVLSDEICQLIKALLEGDVCIAGGI